MLEVQDKYNNRPGGAPTAFLEQGMNPGQLMEQYRISLVVHAIKIPSCYLRVHTQLG